MTEHAHEAADTGDDDADSACYPAGREGRGCVHEAAGSAGQQQTTTRTCPHYDVRGVIDHSNDISWVNAPRCRGANRPAVTTVSYALCVATELAIANFATDLRVGVRGHSDVHAAARGRQR